MPEYNISSQLDSESVSDDLPDLSLDTKADPIWSLYMDRLVDVVQQMLFAQPTAPHTEPTSSRPGNKNSEEAASDTKPAPLQVRAEKEERGQLVDTLLYRAVFAMNALFLPF